MTSFYIVPYLPGMLAFLLLTFVLITYVWTPNGIPEKLQTNPIFRALKSMIYIFYFGFGVIFMDTVGVWTSGVFGFADWRYQLTSIIFCLIIGLQFLFGTWLARPRKITLIYGIIIAMVVPYYIHYYIPNQERLRTATMGLFVILAIFIAIAWAGGLIEELSWRKKAAAIDRANTYLWDFSSRLKQIFSRKVNLILWIIMLIDTAFKFYGGSLLIWPF